MLFSSYVFVLAFLPVAVLGYWWIQQRRGLTMALTWLTACSLFFYGWWNPAYLILIVGLMLFNFYVGKWIFEERFLKPKTLMIGGIVVNLSVLAYYKYMDFFIGTVNDLTGSQFNLLHIILPLGISFFTFQKIAFLVDSYYKKIDNYSLLHYSAFVTFFPGLIAGPIVHYRELVPEFMRLERFSWQQMGIGIAIFAIGLFKKVVIADNISAPVGPIFNAAAQGVEVSFFEAWGGLLAYTAQLYFDFSGYSDMAIGLALMFGVRLPLNFFSPFKSRNIKEFWRRWHITLSRFLQEYIYIALGGSRNGNFKRYRNLFATMLIGGLWHGAAWTFVFWGAMHGTYLVICHLWDGLVKGYKDMPRFGKFMKPIAHFLFFFSLVISLAFFRADSFPAAIEMLQGAFGLNGVLLDPDETRWFGWLSAIGMPVEFSPYAVRFVDSDVLNWLIGAYFIIWCLPNTAQLFAKYNPAIDSNKLLPENPSRMSFAPNWRWASFTAMLIALALLNMNSVSEFLYFRF